MAIYDELPVYKATYDLLLEMFRFTKGFSKEYKYAAIGTKYGKLYNWFAVADSRKIAPTGWHVASDVEWITLKTYVSANLGTSGSVAKALAAKTEWASSTGSDAIGNDLTKNNSTGFTALPGGYRYNDMVLGRIYNGVFDNIGYDGYWWSSTEYDTDNAWYRNLYYANNYMDLFISYKSCGFSVRCVKD